MLAQYKNKFFSALWFLFFADCRQNQYERQMYFNILESAICNSFTDLEMKMDK